MSRFSKVYGELIVKLAGVRIEGVLNDLNGITWIRREPGSELWAPCDIHGEPLSIMGIYDDEREVMVIELGYSIEDYVSLVKAVRCRR